MSLARADAYILLVEDDREMRELATCCLEAEGFRVKQVANGMEAFEVLEKVLPDLVVLDMMMPAITGLEVLQNIRQRSTAVPIFILSALGSEENRVRGLQLGADDYLTKPYSPREFLARVHALLRRAGATAGPNASIVFDGLAIDLHAREVVVGGRPVEMTVMEFDLLAFLASHPGRVYSRQQLLREVWQSSAEWQQSSTVTEHIRRLRVKLEERPDRPRWIHTVRGVGYRFERRKRVTAWAG